MRLILTYCLCSVAFSQTAAVHPFEAVSIHPHEGPMRTVDAKISGPRLSWEAANLRMLLIFAYDLRYYQISGDIPLLTGPDQRFTILAKAEGDDVRPMGEFRQMVQLMLANRFGVKVHREMREIPVYALVVAKGGVKMKTSTVEEEVPQNHSVRGRNDEVTDRKATMPRVLGAIGGLDRPLIDRTGLTGTYDLHLIFSPPGRVREDDPDYINVFSAVQEQLGLKLEPRKEMIEMLVIDDAHRPTEN